MCDSNEDKVVSKAIRFARKLNGLKYACWKPSMGFKDEDGPPFGK